MTAERPALEALRNLAQAGRDVDARLGAKVREARRLGKTWDAIGRAAGMSPRTVARRYDLHGRLHGVPSILGERAMDEVDPDDVLPAIGGVNPHLLLGVLSAMAPSLVLEAIEQTRIYQEDTQ